MQGGAARDGRTRAAAAAQPGWGWRPRSLSRVPVQPERESRGQADSASAGACRVSPVKRACCAAEGPYPPARAGRSENITSAPSRRRESSGGSAPEYGSGLRPQAPMSEPSGSRPLHTHIPLLCGPWPRPLEKYPGAAGSGRRSAAPHTRVGGDDGGAGAGRPRAGAGRAEAPGRGGRGAADAEARDARGGRRLRAAAGRGALETRRSKGDTERSMKSPRGRGRGPVLGRLSGGPRHPWLGGGRGGALGVSRGLRAGSQGMGPPLGRVTPGLTGRLAGRLVSWRRRRLGVRWSRQPRAAGLGGFFGNLQMFS